MRLKLKIGVLSLTLLLFSLILYSCVDEPFIDPAKRPFSEIRVLNLSHNVNNMSVFIDGQQPVASLNAMARPSTTEYFDVQSGERLFEIRDEAGKPVFSKLIELASYERMQIIFAGEFLDGFPLLSTFAEIRVFEGYVYVDHSPAPGTSVLTIIHAAAPYDTVTERAYDKLSAIAPQPDGTTAEVVYIDPNIPAHNPLEYEGVYIIDSAYAGPYVFTFTTGTGSSAPSVSYSTEFTSDKKGYIYIYGRPEDVQFFSYEIQTPPARQRN